MASGKVLLVEPSWDLRDPKSTGKYELEGEFEKELVIYKEKEKFYYGSASSSNSERFVRNYRLDWSDQERHGAFGPSVVWLPRILI